jgi:hypothetical protein
VGWDKHALAGKLQKGEQAAFPIIYRPACRKGLRGFIYCSLVGFERILLLLALVVDLAVVDVHR